MKYILLFTMISVSMISCAPRYPVIKAEIIDSRPTLSFEYASKGSILLVDGINMGDVSIYNGKPKVLSVEPGTHEIIVTANGVPVFQQTIFVESEHKTINIR